KKSSKEQPDGVAQRDHHTEQPKQITGLNHGLAYPITRGADGPEKGWGARPVWSLPRDSPCWQSNSARQLGVACQAHPRRGRVHTMLICGRIGQVTVETANDWTRKVIEKRLQT